MSILMEVNSTYGSDDHTWQWLVLGLSKCHLKTIYFGQLLHRWSSYVNYRLIECTLYYRMDIWQQSVG